MPLAEKFAKLNIDIAEYYQCKFHLNPPKKVWVWFFFFFGSQPLHHNTFILSVYISNFRVGFVLGRSKVYSCQSAPLARTGTVTCPPSGCDTRWWRPSGQTNGVCGQCTLIVQTGQPAPFSFPAGLFPFWVQFTKNHLLNI